MTAIVQLAPAATLDPQLLLSAKLPEALMLVSERAALPLLDSVTDWAALVVLIVWLLKASELGDRLTLAVPTPAPVTGSTKLAVGLLLVR